MDCRDCAYPNPYWQPRCSRCGASLHSLRVRLLVPVVMVLGAAAGLVVLVAAR